MSNEKHLYEGNNYIIFNKIRKKLYRKHYFRSGLTNKIMHIASIELYVKLKYIKKRKKKMYIVYKQIAWL